jgi:hypothetical protein
MAAFQNSELKLLGMEQTFAHLFGGPLTTGRSILVERSGNTTYGCQVLQRYAVLQDPMLFVHIALQSFPGS